MPLFQSAELDDNRDGKTDRIEIAMQMPLAPTETVNGFTALVYSNSKLESKAKYIFDSASYVNYESMSAMTQLNIDGDFVLRQTWPLTAKGGYGRLPVVTFCHSEFCNLVLFEPVVISIAMRHVAFVQVPPTVREGPPH
jgi:hypothetical protein